MNITRLHSGPRVRRRGRIPPFPTRLHVFELKTKNNYVGYLNLMPLHVSSTMCSSSGGQNCIIQHLVSPDSVVGRPVGSPLSTCAPDGHLQCVTIPDAV